MKIVITTYDDRGNEILSRFTTIDNDTNLFEDRILYSIVNDTQEKLCDTCKGTGKVWHGQDDDMEEKDCHCVDKAPFEE